MRPIANQALRLFWSAAAVQGQLAPARRAVKAWMNAVHEAAWANFADVRRTFGSADQVGHCVVFDIGNNRWRLIARINYRTHLVYVLRVMTHAEYDRNDWVEDCGCRKPWPAHPRKAAKAAPKKKPLKKDPR